MRSSDIKRVLEDKDTLSPLPLIERELGGITYEHRLAEHFYRDVYMGAAERNYYIDRYHELCLCAYFNRRVPGKYEFIPEYQFFVTKKRMCLDIYWNLGYISDESMVVEKYDGIEAAKESHYYKDFVDLKEMIDKSIKWKKDHIFGPFDIGGMSSFQYSPCKGTTYAVHEIPIKERQEILQLYMDPDTEKLMQVTVSKVLLSDLMRFFKDFESLDENELHLRTFLPVQEYALADGSLYHGYYTQVVEWLERMKNVRWD